jgi:hypothetical protein
MAAPCTKRFMSFDTNLKRGFLSTNSLQRIIRENENLKMAANIALQSICSITK